MIVTLISNVVNTGWFASTFIVVMMLSVGFCKLLYHFGYGAFDALRVQNQEIPSLIDFCPLSLNLVRTETTMRV